MKSSLFPLVALLCALAVSAQANPKSAALAQQRNKAAHQQVNANNAKKAQALLLQKRKPAFQVSQQPTVDQKFQSEPETPRYRELQ